MDKTRYLAELTKLLGFMSSWDRQTALKKYEQLFDDSADTDALIEELGTPTRVAVELARNYVPTPPPAVEAPPVAERAPEPARAEEAENAENAEDGTEPEKRRARAVGVIGAVLLFIVIGLPVTFLALCIGLPFLSGGAAVIAAAVSYVLRVLPNLMLVSDILLMLGGGCAVSALGLLLTCFGLWLSVILAYLWLSKAVRGLWRLLVFGKEAVQA